MCRDTMPRSEWSWPKGSGSTLMWHTKMWYAIETCIVSAELIFCWHSENWLSRRFNQFVFIYCLNIHGSELWLFLNGSFTCLCRFPSCVYRIPVDRRSKHEALEPNWSNWKFTEQLLFCIVFHFGGMWGGGAFFSSLVTTDFLSEFITFDRLRLPCR